MFEQFFQRVVGVFRLNPATFEDVEHDPTATGQAALVIFLVAVLTGLGGGFISAFGAGPFVRNFLSSMIWAFIGWFLWAVVSFLVGTSLFGGKADLGEMLRVLGFAMAPLSLSIIPCLGGIIGMLWALSAGFVAVRQGLDFDNFRALATILIGFIIFAAGYIAIAIFTVGLGWLF